MTNKPRKKKKRKKKHPFLRLLMIIAIGVGLYFFVTSEIFDIVSVEIENNSYYTVEQVKDRAGIKIGKNIFELKKSTIKEKLLGDPYFENVVIKRRLPATVIVQVTERIEKAAIVSGGAYIIIDGNGMVLRKAETAPKLTLIEGLTVKIGKEGKPLDVEENSMLTDTLNMLREMEDSDLFFKKIDISNVVIKAYIYDQLICEGTPASLTESIKNGNLEKTIYAMYNDGIERGVIKIGSDNYCSFSPSVE